MGPAVPAAQAQAQAQARPPSPWLPLLVAARRTRRAEVGAAGTIKLQQQPPLPSARRHLEGAAGRPLHHVTQSRVGGLYM